LAAGWSIWFRELGRGVGIVLVAAFACLSYTWIKLPDVRSLRTQPPAMTSFMQLREAQARAAGKAPRTIQKWVNANRISPRLREAVLVAEDGRFFEHDGLDLAEVRASIVASWNKGDRFRGSSTLTQQLAKNLYLDPSRNPYRKLTELLIARRLEAEIPKARLLELYLNLIEWGDGIWGAEAAARTYFGIPASDLSASQAALLAGAIINPRIYSPAHPNARLLRRQAIILGRMSQ
jgi:monofunctional glycosyltransferase